MKEYSNAHSNLPATLNKDLDHEPDFQELKKNQGSLYSQVYNEIICDSSMTDAEFRVYSHLAGTCNSKNGYCSKTYKTLAAELGKSDTYIKKICVSLTKKGFLFKKQMSKISGGSFTRRVVKCHYEKRIDKLLRENKIEDAAEVGAYFTPYSKEYLVEHYKIGKGIQKKISEGYSQGPYEGYSQGPSNNSINTIKRINNKRDDLDPPDRESAAAVIDLKSKEYVTAELKKLKRDKQIIKDALTYLDIHWEYLKSKNNPFRYLVELINRGVTTEAVQNHTAEKVKEQEETTQLETNKYLAEKLNNDMDEHRPFVNVFVNNCDVRMEHCSYENMETFEGKEVIDLRRLHFKMPDFEKQINEFKRGVQEWLKKKK